MYGKEERQKAVDLYIKYGKRAATVVSELGYTNRHTLRLWYKEFKEEGKLREGCKKREGHSLCRDYDDSQVRAAVDHFLTHGRSYSWTVKALGYPSRAMLKRWVKLVALTLGRHAHHLGGMNPMLRKRRTGLSPHTAGLPDSRGAWSLPPHNLRAQAQARGNGLQCPRDG